MNTPPVTVWVRSAGWLSTVQDLGRAGQRRHGISVCGALEDDHLRLANAAVGNPEGAAALELSGGRVALTLSRPTWACWLGQGAASVGSGRPQRLLNFEASGRGLLALAGGVAVAPLHGSRSTDLRAGFGGFHGRALRRGDLLPLGIAPSETPAPGPPWRLRPAVLEGAVRAVPGPEWARLTTTARCTLEGAVFTVSAQSNRMGLRLDGPLLEGHPAPEMRSGAVLPGTVQLPPGGQMIVLLKDAGTVGGYPRILQIAQRDLPRLAVLPPGSSVRLRLIPAQQALALHLERQRDLERQLRCIQARRRMPG